MGRHAALQTGPYSHLSPAAGERAELCELFAAVGENAPTLSEGWDAGDLAAHLLTRESRPDAVIGLVIPPLRGYTAKLEKETRESLSFSEIVGRLRSGPSLRTPLGLPVVKDRANLHEFFIHHEDVRRAQPGWQVRELSPATSAGLWNLVRMMAPLLLRGVRDTRVKLATPDGAERFLGRPASANQVTITGAPGELLIYLSGRRGAAEVRVTGSPSGQARLAAAKLGM